MSDSIDRNKTLEAVTDAISKYIPLLEGDAIKIPLDVARVIMNMPSAQPENKQETKQQATKTSDCINRQDAIDAVAEGLKNVFVEYRDVAEKLIGKLPSVTPKQKTGKWIYGENLSNGHDGYFCSECGWFAAVDYDFPINSEENKPTNYCPNCGAMMKGADDGTR